MKIKFLAKTMPEYKGISGNNSGEVISLKAGDVCEINDDIAKLLLLHHSRDFEVSVEQEAEHAPKKDKQLKKTLKFKSK